MRRFARQRFGPGLEETFLASRGGRGSGDLLLLRVRDAGLARELWIRLEEGETTFAEAAHQHGVGEEAQRKGVIGPMPIGSLQPEVLQEILRSLRPGELSAPRQLGEWHVLMRLEQLKPARFDEACASRMQQEALERIPSRACQVRFKGEADSLEPIHYDPESMNEQPTATFEGLLRRYPAFRELGDERLQVACIARAPISLHGWPGAP